MCRAKYYDVDISDDSLDINQKEEPDVSIIPPLDLHSNTSSVTDEHLEGSLDIDLRGKIDNTNRVQMLNNTPTKSGRIQRQEPDEDRITSGETVSSPKSDSCPVTVRNEEIFIGNMVIGRSIKQKPLKTPRQNFVQSNKELKHKRQVKVNYTYGALHQLKRNNPDETRERLTPNNRRIFSALSSSSLPESTRWEYLTGHEIDRQSSITNNTIKNGFKQHLELMEACRKFFDSRFVMQSPTELTSPKDRSSNTSASIGLYALHANSPKRPHKYQSLPYINQSHAPTQTKRYISKYSTKLPKISSTPRSLGPDLESEDYQKRLLKKRRQQAYAELVRGNSLKSFNSTWNSKTGTFDPMQFASQKISLPKSEVNLAAEHDTQQMSSHSSTHDPAVESLGSCVSLPPMHPDLKSTEGRRKRVPRVIEDKQKLTAKRRLAMLNYAEHVRRNLKLACMQSKNAKQNPLKINEVETTTLPNVSPGLESNLEDLLRRFEEDKKMADTIRNSLKL